MKARLKLKLSTNKTDSAPTSIFIGLLMSGPMLSKSKSASSKSSFSGSLDSAITATKKRAQRQTTWKNVIVSDDTKESNCFLARKFVEPKEQKDFATVQINF